MSQAKHGVEAGAILPTTWQTTVKVGSYCLSGRVNLTVGQEGVGKCICASVFVNPCVCVCLYLCFCMCIYKSCGSLIAEKKKIAPSTLSFLPSDRFCTVYIHSSFFFLFLFFYNKDISDSIKRHDKFLYQTCYIFVFNSL